MGYHGAPVRYQLDAVNPLKKYPSVGLSFLSCATCFMHAQVTLSTWSTTGFTTTAASILAILLSPRDGRDN
jgi:hypothetical protein